MSMGYGANYTDIVSKEDLIKITKDIGNDFFDNFSDDYDLDSFAQDKYQDSENYKDLDIENPEKLFASHEKRFIKMRDLFLLKTQLDIEIGYHSVDGGSCYIDGYFFGVWNVYKKTPEADEFEKTIGHTVKRKFFVTYG